MRTYADWFASARLGPRVKRLISRETETMLPKISGLEDVDDSIFDSFTPIRPKPFLVENHRGNRRVREDKVRALLSNWKDGIENAASVGGDMSELLYCLDPGGSLELSRDAAAASDASFEVHRETVRKALADLEKTYERQRRV